MERDEGEGGTENDSEGETENDSEEKSSEEDEGAEESDHGHTQVNMDFKPPDDE